MRLLLVALLLPALLVGAGCRASGGDRHAETGHEAGHADHGHEAEGHGHAHGAPTETRTLYSAHTELFAEFPALVVGQASPVAAHLTDLRDWSPVGTGRVEAVLTAPDGTTQSFPIDAPKGPQRGPEGPEPLRVPSPAVPGIFKPVITPASEGTYVLTFKVTTAGRSETLSAGAVTVYPSLAVAQAAHKDEPENPDAIAFTKEQQWKLPFLSRPVAAQALAAGIELQGVVKPAGGREVAIAAPATGRIALGHGRLPQVGQRVAAGQVLAVLTPSEGADTDRAGLRQAVRSAEATVAQTRLDLARAERLVAAQAAPAKRAEEARTALAIAQSQLAAARDHLRAKEATLEGAVGVTEESYRLRAPISGTITEAAVVPGASVATGAELYHLVDLTTVWVEARVSEPDLARVAEAKKATVTLTGGPGHSAGGGEGRLVTLGSVLDAATRTAPVIYAVPNPQGAFRIGMTASVRAVTGTGPRGPVIPQSAVVDDNGRPIAYVQTSGETFARRPLTLGVKSGEVVQVLDGLHVGERLVTHGGYEIRLSTLSNAVPDHGHAH
jgi:RND family efflux transporter MFP subunit